MKNFHFDTICRNTQEPQELQRYSCACGFISKSSVIIYHQLLSKVISINVKLHFSNNFLLYPSLSLLLFRVTKLFYFNVKQLAQFHF